MSTSPLTQQQVICVYLCLCVCGCVCVCNSLAIFRLSVQLCLCCFCLCVCVCTSAVHFFNSTDLKSSVNAGSTGTERDRDRERLRNMTNLSCVEHRKKESVFVTCDLRRLPWNTQTDETRNTLRSVRWLRRCLCEQTIHLQNIYYFFKDTKSILEHAFL